MANLGQFKQNPHVDMHYHVSYEDSTGNFEHDEFVC